MQRQTLVCIILENHCGLPMSKSCGFVAGFQNVYFQYLSVTQGLLYVFCSPILPSLTDTLIYVLIHALGISVMALNKIVKNFFLTSACSRYLSCCMNMDDSFL